MNSTPLCERLRDRNVHEVAAIIGTVTMIVCQRRASADSLGAMKAQIFVNVSTVGERDDAVPFIGVSRRF